MKVPATPPSDLIFEPDHVRFYEGALWRVFRTVGKHALEWDELRHFGPVKGMRFDPQPPPPGEHPDNGVMYAATLPYTALGEVYQSSRVIDRAAGGATIVSWRPSRPLRLLDLTTNWPVVNGAAASMMMGHKSHTQAWAQAIFDELGDEVDGLYHLSSINNEPMVTLFSRAEEYSAFPARASFRALLSDTSADEIVAQATKKLGFTSL